MRHYRSFISWLRSWILLAPLALAGCSTPYMHQKKLSLLHTQAARACINKVLTCASLMPCSAAVRTALADWQAVGTAVSRGDDAGEAAGLIAAGSSEIAAMAACKMVK